MRKFTALLLTLGVIAALWGAPASASPAAQGDSPAITSFTSTTPTVDRAALADRTARIPVSWTTINRPLTANLFFEQVLPDGSAINVELPRAVPWVNSSGDGVAAPILPEGNPSQITLRVRLVNLLTGQVYSERQLTFNITTGGGTQPGNTNRPAITRFVTSAASVRAEQLANGTARVPVSWTAVNRPVTSNLVFEQVLPDGSAVNVELPRENPWVNSVGDGVAAPILPEGNPSQITLRVRLLDLLSGRIFDQRELTLAIDSTPAGQPNIRAFTTSFTSVDASELAARTARVPVSWAVDNRPDGSNLVFEQVLPGGSIINVELPRTVPIVPSSGNGTAAPILPSGAGEILLRVRLVNLRDNATIAQREITLPIRGSVGSGTIVVDPTQCFNNPFISGNGLAVNSRARVLVSAIPAYSAPLTETSIGTIQQGETVSIIGGPYCYYLSPMPGPDQQGNFRMWRVRVEGRSLEGWAQEYSIGIAGVTRHLEPASGAQPGDPQIVSFAADMENAQAGDTVNVTWEVRNAQSVTLRAALTGPDAVDFIREGLPLSGAQAITIPENVSSTGNLYLYVYTQPNAPAVATGTITLGLACDTSFFFGTGEDCVTGEPVSVQGAYQTFQNGVMVWRSDTRQVYVLLNNGTGQTLVESWDGLDITFGQPPPAGAQLPQRGFGSIWVQNQAVRDAIGWATGAEQSFTGQFQMGVAPGTSQNIQYFSLPDGRTVRFENRSGQTAWRYV